MRSFPALATLALVGTFSPTSWCERRDLPLEPTLNRTSSAHTGTGGDDVCADLAEVWRGVRAQFSATDVARVERYLGQLPADIAAATRGQLDLEAAWGPLPAWGPPRHSFTVGDRCGACSPDAQRTAAGVSYTSNTPTTARVVRTCSKLEDVWAILELAARGMKCLHDAPLVVHYGPHTCVDDTVGLHVPPTLTKNRPIIRGGPRTVGGVTARDNGVLLPLQWARHFEEPLEEAAAVRAAGSEPPFLSKRAGAVWRGGAQART
jgi:hypothetical protein